MPKITIEVTEEALENFKKVVEDETGHTVTDPLALYEECLNVDVKDSLESYAYFISEGDTLYDDEYPGLVKN